jgi:dTDP-4-dehydrorhamnose 3,5-epimerase
MDIHVTDVEIEGPLIIEPDCFHDDRGFFFESYRQDRFITHGLDYTFVQDNHSRSARGVLRGFHYQDSSAPQARLVRCTVGEVWDVIVDLRYGSPTFGHYLGITLTAESRRQILIPPQFAHGFVTLSESAEVQYKCTAHHTPSAERSLAWNDPDLSVKWPIPEPVLSVRDRHAPSFRDYIDNPVFIWREFPVQSEKAVAS